MRGKLFFQFNFFLLRIQKLVNNELIVNVKHNPLLLDLFNEFEISFAQRRDETNESNETRNLWRSSLMAGPQSKNHCYRQKRPTILI